MMTQTLKIKRPVVTEHYRGIIEGMFQKSWSVWALILGVAYLRYVLPP
jgi:hypothetical protein